MSLQVWLPLNGNLENKGLGNFSFSTLGTITYPNGKIGKCMKAGDGTQIVNGVSGNSNLISELGDEYSCAVWVCPDGTHIHYNGTILSSGNWNSSCWAFGVNQNNTAVDVFCKGYNTYINCNVPVGQWTHLACTQKDKIVKLYKNGEYVGSYTASQSALTSDANNFCVGRETYASGYFSFNGKINDVRIYNHCLSDKEVKELAKGLVLHYKLDDGYTESTTNIDSLKNTKPSFNNLSLCEEVILEGKKCWHCIAEINNTSSWNGSYNSAKGFSANTVLTRSCELYIPSGQNTTRWHGVPFAFENCSNVSAHNYDRNNYNTWQHCWCTATASSTSSNFLFYWLSVSSGSAKIEFYITNIQLEEKDHATPYTPSSRNENVIYDSSGYGYNGTVNGTISVDNFESPRYLNCTRIPTATTITHPRAVAGDDSQEWTCCAWVYMKDYNAGTFLNNFNCGNELCYGTSPLLYLNMGSYDYYIYGNALETNKWMHIAFVFRNSDYLRKIYRDGVDISTSGPQSNHPSGISDTVTLLSNFNGYITDYREYATALSAADIKELYETSASIDKNGNLYCREIVEV